MRHLPEHARGKLERQMSQEQRMPPESKAAQQVGKEVMWLID
jgi:hypothetical protein